MTPEAKNWRQALKERGLGNPTARAATALAFVVLLTLLIAPTTESGGPAIDATNVGSVARADVAATHDFSFEASDPAEIERVRADAAAQVIPIWDYDRSAVEALDARISAAFDEVRLELLSRGRSEEARLAAELEVVEGSGEGSGEPPFEEPPLPMLDTEVIQLVPDDVRAAVVSESPAMAALLDAARIREQVDLAAFQRDGFAVPTRDALRGLVNAAMESTRVVESIVAVEAIGPGGITLRTLNLGVVEGERRVHQFTGDWGDLARVPESLDRAPHHLSSLSDLDLRAAVVATAEALVVANTRPNEAETSALRASEMTAAEQSYRLAQTMTFLPGETIVSQGDPITQTHVAVIAAMQASAPPQQSRFQSLLGTGALVVLLIFPLLLFSLQNLSRFSRREKDLAMMSAVLLFHLLITRISIYFAEVVAQDVGIPMLAVAALIPFAAGAMLVRILTNAENALLYALVYAMLAGVLFRFDVGYSALALLSAVVGNASVRGVQTRTDILRASALVSLMTVGIAMAYVLIRGTVGEAGSLYVAGAAILSGLTTALFVFATLPVVESLFRYTTPMRLMELANLNHPALRELILKAPGSYHHSMMVGQLVEAACERVGADALLGRVGSYFHDIGKMKTPQYFAENQQGANPHDKLKPNMSALVIKSHVKDGVELARQYKLPREIIDFIKEHHGTSLIQYFHHRAQEQSDVEVSETDYRYPGPKPQSRETAICLLADGIEAASRALPDPSHSHLKGLVQKMINKAFIDGQLDECDLTLLDLNAIAQAFLLRLTAFYHHRPEYPDGRKSQTTRRTRRHDVASRPPTPPEPHDDGADGPGGPAGDKPGDGEETAEASGVHLRRLEM